MLLRLPQFSSSSLLKAFLLLTCSQLAAHAQTGTFLDNCTPASPEYTCMGYDTDAVINVGSTLTAIANCHFIGCPEVYAQSPMSFTNVTFTASTYQYPDDAVPGGGAIRVMADVIISNSTFDSCEASAISNTYEKWLYC